MAINLSRVPLRLGPREANCLFVLRVYGLSVAQLTGNLNLKEKAHQSPLSASCVRTESEARHRGGSYTQSIAMPCSVMHHGCKGRR